MKRNAQLLLLIIGAVLILFYLQDWQRWMLDSLNIGLSLTVLFIGIIIFLENRNPSRTITWLMLLAIFPIVGFIFYMLFGQSYRKKRLFRKRAHFDHISFEATAVSKVIDQEKLKIMGEHQQSTLRLAQRLGQYPVSFATETKVLTNGSETFKAILEAIEQAKSHIHLEYYIVRHISFCFNHVFCFASVFSLGIGGLNNWFIQRSLAEMVNWSAITVDIFSSQKWDRIVNSFVLPSKKIR